MDKTNSAQMAKLAIKALEDKKAEDVRVIDISEISVLADYFIIANGLNVSQVQALPSTSCTLSDIACKIGRASCRERV